MFDNCQDFNHLFFMPFNGISRENSVDAFLSYNNSAPRKLSSDYYQEEENIDTTASVNPACSPSSEAQAFETFDPTSFSSPAHNPYEDKEAPAAAMEMSASKSEVLVKRRLPIEEDDDLELQVQQPRVQKKVKNQQYNPTGYDYSDSEYIPSETKDATEESEELEIPYVESQKPAGKSSKKSGKPQKSDSSSDKKLKIQKGILKNYISTTSNAFGSLIIMEGQVELRSILAKRVQNSQVSQDDILAYIRKNIEGKVPKSTQDSQSKWRQYKVSNRKEIEQVFQDQNEDCDQTRRLKEVLRQIITDFFRSKTYTDWVHNYYETKVQEYRDFLANKTNIEEMINIYCRPNCKPHFDTC